MSDTVIQQLLKEAKTIAIVGLSAKSGRASHEVAAYLQKNGYRIIPVNPNEAGNHILNETCYASLTEAVAATGLHIDIVDCFRKSADIPAIADEAIRISAACLWMQLDVVNESAAEKAKAAGLHVVMDRCTKIEHALWLSRKPR